jgi:hypothetical protein
MRFQDMYRAFPRLSADGINYDIHAGRFIFKS